MKNQEFKNVKTIEDLKNLLNGKQLIMFSVKEPFGTLDARKKDGFEWKRFFIYKFNERGFIHFISPIGIECNHFSDLTKLIRDGVDGYQINEEKQRSEQAFNLFLYNLKRGNTMYITDNFIPDNIRLEMQKDLKIADKLFIEGKQIIKDRGYNITEQLRKKYRKIPNNAVCSREGYYQNISYSLNGRRFDLKCNYHEKFQWEILEKQTYSTWSPNWSWLELSNYRDSINRDYNIYKCPSKFLKQAHSNFQTAINIQTNVCKTFHEWYKTINNETIICK